jgi:hypothetical protein
MKSKQDDFKPMTLFSRVTAEVGCIQITPWSST